MPIYDAVIEVSERVRPLNNDESEENSILG